MIFYQVINKAVYFTRMSDPPKESDMMRHVHSYASELEAYNVVEVLNAELSWWVHDQKIQQLMN